MPRRRVATDLFVYVSLLFIQYYQMPNDNHMSDHTSKGKDSRSMGKRQLLLIFTGAVFVWSLIWTSAISIMMVLGMFITPALVITFIISLPRSESIKWRFLSIATGSGLASLLLLSLTAWGLSSLLADTTTYYLGIDIETPSGVITKRSMVQSSHHQLSPVMRHFNLSEPEVKGEAVFCSLDNGKNVVVSLYFHQGIHGKGSIHILPWIAAGYSTANQKTWPKAIKGKHELGKELTPLLVTFRKIDDPKSFEKVILGRESDLLGPEIKIVRVWVEMTSDPYKSFGIEEHIGWVNEFSYKRSASIFSFAGYTRSYSPLIL